jgi:hypothetical protein
MTNSWTEADLEASIHGVLKKAFPWLPAHSIRHQTKFSFTFGGKKIEIDGRKASRAEARADILLYNREEALAVLELKRSGISLTPSDDAQGLSYARVIDPPPPLVIVTNGDELHFIETYSGKSWQPSQYSEQAFQDLVTNTAKLAASDTKQAVDTLMGTNASVWQQAVRHTSKDILTELSASWEKPAFPFVRNFLIPRKTTAQALELISNNAKFILVEGAPMAGKSNVLREITLRTIKNAKISTLYIEGGVGRGILQTLADALTRSIAWPVSTDEVRNWLIHVSQVDDGQKLLLAIDGLYIDDIDGRKEIEDLSSSTFSDGLALMVALDDTVAEQLVSIPSCRSASAIGRRAKRITVNPLNDREFKIAQIVLSRHQIYLMHGANATPEYRQPWVLRAISAPVLDQRKTDHFAMMPPLLSLNLIALARERFTDEKPRRFFRAIANALLIDYRDQDRDYTLVLESCETYLVQRKELSKHLETTEIQWLIDHGFLRPAIHISGEPILYIRLPELLASEIARLLADELITQVRKDHRKAATWIAGVASDLPIGDVIAAQAIFDAVQRQGGLPFKFINVLIETIPKKEHVVPGTRMATHYPGVGLVELSIENDGSAVVDINGHLHPINIEDDDFGYIYSNIYEWLILSHLASMPFKMDIADRQERVDAQILLIVGTADIVLRKPGGSPGMRSILTHDLSEYGIGSIVCHKAGIVEPITYSIFLYLKREGVQASHWIDQAINYDSYPLISRIHIALLELSSISDDALSAWANSILEHKIKPALNVFLKFHEDDT